MEADVGRTLLIDTPRVYVGAYALCTRRDRQILLVRLGTGESDAAGSWALPGGGLNWGEAPEAGVLRELEEETGLTGTRPQLAGIFSATYPRSPARPRDSVHYLGILYFVDTLPGDLRYEQSGSTDLCAWLPIDDLADRKLVPVAQYGLELVARRTVAEPAR